MNSEGKNFIFYFVNLCQISFKSARQSFDSLTLRFDHRLVGLGCCFLVFLASDISPG